MEKAVRVREHIYEVGPNGGQFYFNSKGHKVYKPHKYQTDKRGDMFYIDAEGKKVYKQKKK